MCLKHPGTSASKYSLDALYFMFQTFALLFSRASHRLIGNKSVKNKPGKSGNILLDLDLELVDHKAFSYTSGRKCSFTKVLFQAF